MSSFQELTPVLQECCAALTTNDDEHLVRECAARRDELAALYAKKQAELKDIVKGILDCFERQLPSVPCLPSCYLVRSVFCILKFFFFFFFSNDHF